jgi:molybdopterin synthase catalytic subunit
MTKMRDDIRIQAADFEPGAEIVALEGGSETGAVASFVGLVRGDDGLTAMTLEHYPAMTAREIEAHVSEARKRWPLLAVRVVHRVGRLTPGDRIVSVSIASMHRQAAFEAAEFLMDYLKTKAPFWKLEERASALSWVEAKAEDDESVRRWR